MGALATTKMDTLIEQIKEEMPEVAAVLAFVKDNGTDATIRLLAAVDRYANAKGFRGRFRTEGPLDEAVALIKDGPWANDDRPWLVLDEKRRAELAAAQHRYR